MVAFRIRRTPDAIMVLRLEADGTWTEWTTLEPTDLVPVSYSRWPLPASCTPDHVLLRHVMALCQREDRDAAER